jgi:glutathione S-transferase
MTAPPHLLHFRVSHYNEKVRWALDFKRWPHTREALIPGFHVGRVRKLTGQNKLPVLVLDGKPLVGSDNILAEIERLRPDPPLFPADPAERLRAVSIQTFFDDEVAPDLRRLFWSTYLARTSDCARMATVGASPAIRVAWRMAFPVMRPFFRRNMGVDAKAVRAAREKLSGYLDRLEAEIGPSGYLVGESFGLADLAAAAVMTAIIRPPEFPYRLPEPWPQELVDLREGVSNRSGFRWVLDIYARHRSPSCEIPAADIGGEA